MKRSIAFAVLMTCLVTGTISGLLYSKFQLERRAGTTTEQSFGVWVSTPRYGSVLGPKVPTPRPTIAKPAVPEDPCPPKSYGGGVYFFPCLGDEFGERLAKWMEGKNASSTYRISAIAPGVGGYETHSPIDYYTGYYVTFGRFYSQ